MYRRDERRWKIRFIGSTERIQRPRRVRYSFREYDGTFRVFSLHLSTLEIVVIYARLLLYRIRGGGGKRIRPEPSRAGGRRGASPGDRDRRICFWAFRYRHVNEHGFDLDPLKIVRK